MSRKRSEAAIERYRERFVDGAARHVRRRRARPPSGCGRWSTASPASASPRPTAPPSACWPTSRPGCACTTAPSSCARCSTSSRWASTPPDSLVHEAQRRGIEVRGRRRQRLARSQCTVEHGASAPAGLGLRQGGVRRRRWRPWSTRVAGRVRSAVGDLAARAGAGRPALEQLAWSGACDALLADGLQAGDRAGAVAAGGGRPGAPTRTSTGGGAPSWRCPLEPPAAPRCAGWGAGSGWWPTTPPPA